jgi:hypothetical protein
MLRHSLWREGIKGRGWLPNFHPLPSETVSQFGAGEGIRARIAYSFNVPMDIIRYKAMKEE